MLTLKLFGAPVVEFAGMPVAGRAAQGHRLALLAVLALAGGRPVSRDRLVALLWPESSADRARHGLSDALYILRAGVGPDAVRTVGDDLVLHPDVASDVSEFEAALARGDHGAAVALVAGPLLDGFHLTDATEFERWLDAERARVRERHAAALSGLAEAADERGEATAAAGWWRRLAALDPCDGRVALRLMRALDAAGDPAGALRHARVHAALLREEFDTEPTQELTSFVERLRRAPQPEPEPARLPPPSPLVPVPDPAGATELADVETASPPPPLTPAPSHRGMSGRLLGAAALLGLVVVGALGAFVAGRGEARGDEAHDGTALEVPATAATRERTARSLAVLPFVNRSPDPANGYFSDGLSEEIITALSRVTGLRVAARTSSFALRDATLDVRVIGDTLNVETVLEGSVRREGNRLRVTAQLVDARSGLLLWSGEYDRDAADALAVQDEIARAIAGALELRIPVRAATTRIPEATSLEAYDLYLRALHLRNDLNVDALRQATTLLDRAIMLEPGFALAHAARASVIAPRMYLGHVPRDQGVRDMRASIARAFALDSTIGEAHVALGILRLFFEWDWSGAERSLRRALELNPSDPHAWHHLANHLHAVGRSIEALDARARGVALDPLNARTRIVLATDLIRVGRADDALAEVERAQSLDPMNPLLLGLGPTLPVIARVQQARGQSEDALQGLMRIAALRDADPADIDDLRTAFARGGMAGMWRQWLSLDRRLSAGAVNPVREALMHAAAGDTLQALQELDRAFTARDPGLIYVNADPMFDPLHGHPRFQRMVAAMRLPRP